jgi:predicted phage terminase large subunit-like protein
MLRKLAEMRLADFTRQAWHIVEPGTPIAWNWHIDAICSHLEAVTDGRIRNLLINIPPRCMKSLLVSVFWPVWSWLRRPSTRWIFSSYSQVLSTRDSLKCRRILESDWFQRNWSSRFAITSDQNQKTRFENDQSGGRIATSVGGIVTGEGGDFIVVDDPHNVLEALSDVQRESALIWWDEAMTTRLNSPTKGGRVIVMQRLHERDLAGHVLEQGGYEHLCLPMEFEPERRCSTSIGWSDPRDEEGELLWPTRFPAHEVVEYKKRMGEFASSGQFQQRPAPRGGGMFKVDRFRLLPDAIPETAIDRTVRYWDKAATEGGGCHSAGVKVAKIKKEMAETLGVEYVVLHAVRGQWGVAEREGHIRSLAELDGRKTEVVVEQEPGSGGKESAEATIRRLAGFKVSADRVTGDKVTRAEPYAVQVEVGNVGIVTGSWAHDFIEEHRLFPASQYKDQVDAAAGAFAKLAVRKHHQIWV